MVFKYLVLTEIKSNFLLIEVNGPNARILVITLSA